MTTPEQSTLENKLIQSLLREQKSTRRWKNARFFTWVILLLLFIFALMAPNFSNESAMNNGKENKSYVSLVHLNGVIAANNSFSAAKVIPILTRAFKDKEAKGVVLIINSPGGSPVQASLIHDKIMQLK